YDTSPYREKFEAFRWNVIELDGHDIDAIKAAFALAKREPTRPTVLLAKTVKGKGFPFAENVVSFHNGALTHEQLEQALSITEGA
ncbi:MAG: transketolase, partial [Clostridia bacterium]